MPIARRRKPQTAVDLTSETTVKALDQASKSLEEQLPGCTVLVMVSKNDEIVSRLNTKDYGAFNEALKKLINIKIR